MLNDILILDQQWLPNQSDFPPISWPWYRAWPSPIMSGFHGAFATGVACQQGKLTLPDTWFRPPLWDLLVLQLLRPDSLELAMSLLDYSHRIPLGTFSILLKKDNGYALIANSSSKWHQFPVAITFPQRMFTQKIVFFYKDMSWYINKEFDGTWYSCSLKVVGW